MEWITHVYAHFCEHSKGKYHNCSVREKKKKKMENLEKNQILERKVRSKEKKVTSEPVGQIKHFNTELVIAGHGWVKTAFVSKIDEFGTAGDFESAE